MYRRYRERRRYRRRDPDRPRRWSFTSAFRTPRTQIAVLLIVALIIFLLLIGAGR